MPPATTLITSVVWRSVSATQARAQVIALCIGSSSRRVLPASRLPSFQAFLCLSKGYLSPMSSSVHARGLRNSKCPDHQSHAKSSQSQPHVFPRGTYCSFIRPLQLLILTKRVEVRCSYAKLTAKPQFTLRGIAKVLGICYLPFQCCLIAQSLPWPIAKRPAVLYHHNSWRDTHPIDHLRAQRLAIHRSHTRQRSTSDQMMIPSSFIDPTVQGNHPALLFCTHHHITQRSHRCNGDFFATHLCLSVAPACQPTLCLYRNIFMTEQQSGQTPFTRHEPSPLGSCESRAYGRSPGKDPQRSQPSPQSHEWLPAP